MTFIEDLRTEERAGPFWEPCANLIQCASVLYRRGKAPTDRYEFTIGFGQAMFLWNMLQAMPIATNEKVLVDADTWKPLDGVHRACVMLVLGMPVPAWLVTRPKHGGRLTFDGMWKWEVEEV